MEEGTGWIEAQFGGAALGDVRRTRRVIALATRMLAQPGASLPQLAPTRYAMKAAYALFAHRASTPAHVQAGHRATVQQRLGEAGQTTLLVEDTTVMSWSGQAPIAGLGPIGSGGDDAGLQGFLLHSVLALRWAAVPGATQPRRPPVELLGVAAQQYHVRVPAPPAEARGPAGSRAVARQGRWRESALWGQSTEQLGRAPTGGAAGRWVRVCDRGADLYEFLAECQQAGHGYVVRAAQDRALADGEGRLFAQLRAQPVLTALTLELRTRPGRPARVAHLAVAALPVRLRAPRRPGIPEGQRTVLAGTAVRVWEPAPPSGTDPLEWLLVSDAPMPTAVAAIECVQQYATRWVIEEFHKVLKTGLGAERLQLEQAERLFAAIAVMSVVAVRLLHLKEWGRVDPDAPAAAAGLSPLEHRLLEAQGTRPLPTVRAVTLALGRLGGYAGPTHTGHPGWLTLWRGLQRLQAMAEGAALVLHDQHAPRFGV